ncbi:hypothetical protein BDZ97DRAFT_1618419, partial [Flammula alnicola]
ETSFRVHRSVLSANSGSFKDMFTISEQEGEPLVEGCPVSHMSDAPQDWENFLSIVYHTSK